MEKTIIFGHLNPDTDSILSAILLAKLENALGGNSKACRIGKVNKETQYVLTRFNIEAPELVESFEEGQKVELVDVNEKKQLPEDITKANIVKVIDHHRMNFETSEPIFYLSKPVGCTATIIYELYNQNNVEIDKQTATLILSCIISDSLLFKSPTCTDEDRKVAKEVSKIAELDIEEYGLEMLKAGTDISDFTASEVVNMDAKVFEGDGYKFAIDQVNTADIDDVFSRREELEFAMEKEIADKNLDLFMLAITDIISADSKVIVLGNKKAVVEKAFGVTLDENDSALLKGVVSRKKQMAPPIIENIF